MFIVLLLEQATGIWPTLIQNQEATGCQYQSII